MVIEYGHIYYEDILNDNIPEIEIKLSIKLALEYIKEHPEEQFKKVVLLDDKNYNLTNEDKIKITDWLYNYYFDLGLKPDYIYFEKIFSNDVDRIYSNISETNIKIEYFKKENKYVEFLHTEKYKIPLKKTKNLEIMYSCQMLASLWTLMKSEIYKDKNIITILNDKYFTVEMHILELLKHSGYSVKNIHLWYSL